MIGTSANEIRGTSATVIGTSANEIRGTSATTELGKCSNLL